MGTLPIRQHPKMLIVVISAIVICAAGATGLIVYLVYRAASHSTAIGLGGQCIPTPTDQTDHVSSLHAVARGNEDFSMRFYRAVVAGLDKDENVVMSPLSVSLVLAMASLGANDQTLSEILDALSLPCSEETLLSGYKSLIRQHQNNNNNNNFTLTMANKMLVSSRYEILGNFLSKTAEFFGTIPETADFEEAPEESRRKMNAWVEQQTSGKIKDLVQAGSLSAATKLVLINAVYFKGIWTNPFNELLMDREDFHGTRSTQKVPMMRKEDFLFLGHSVERLGGARVLRLTYQGDSVAMYLMLPAAASSSSMAELERKLSEGGANLFDEVDRGLKKQWVSLRLPRFTLESRLELREVLQSLGASLVFVPGSANLARMVAETSSDLHVSDVLQKAFVEVNEKGTEAAAATGVNFRSEVVGFPDPVEFVCDRPFVFLIRDVSVGMTIFVGRFVQAQQQQQDNVDNG